MVVRRCGGHKQQIPTEWGMWYCPKCGRAATRGGICQAVSVEEGDKKAGPGSVSPGAGEDPRPRVRSRGDGPIIAPRFEKSAWILCRLFWIFGGGLAVVGLWSLARWLLEPIWRM